jgi:glycosyltransferase involved in cell wall biosynthesis
MEENKKTEVEVQVEPVKRKKILMWCDGPMVTTGFGTVARNVAAALQATGRYEIHFVAVNFWGEPFDQREYPYIVMPAAIERREALKTQVGDPFGGFNFANAYWNGGFDAIWIMNDINILAQRAEIFDQGPQGQKKQPKCPIIYYFPVDSVWLDKGMLSGFGKVDYPVSYNEYAKKLIATVDPALAKDMRVINHGSDVDTFHRIEDQGEVMDFRRNTLGVDDGTILFSQVARNQYRKANGDLILAFADFKKKNPSKKAKLYMHMNPQDQGPMLFGALLSVGLKLGEDVIFPSNHSPGRAVPKELVNMVYNATDVFCTATLGEGWGLPITEAMAAETPVIAPDNTAISEILGVDNEEGPRGWAVPCGEWPMGLIHIDGTGFRPRVNVSAMSDLMNEVGTLALERRASGEVPEGLRPVLERAKEFAQEICWKNIGDQWVDLIDEVIK